MIVKSSENIGEKESIHNFCENKNNGEVEMTEHVEQEFEVLVPSIKKKSNFIESEPKTQQQLQTSCRGWLTLLLVAFIVLAITVGLLLKKSDSSSQNTNLTTTTIQFSCPVTVPVPKDYDDSSFTEEYLQVDNQILSDFTNFQQTYQNLDFDGWGVTYKDVKKALYDWKSRRFVANLKDGDKIFESACGVGLSLLMTLEMAKEVKGIKNLEVYGNEYLEKSTVIANRILDTMAPTLQFQKGIICAADSTNLQFVPENAFDLVFTGYISTLLNPLEFDAEITDELYNDYYVKLCHKSTRGDWEAKKLNEIAQQRQNDWFGLWISEMVRIAKPGAPILFEEVSYQFCDYMDDWGGVSHEFWMNGADNYNWDVDTSSIQFENSTVFPYRYHVFMRKNK